MRLVPNPLLFYDMNRSFLLLFLLIYNIIGVSAQLGPTPKREFRGTWIQCVNGQFQGMTPQQMQENLTRQLDVCKAAGVNVVMFQVRSEADALYDSLYEPWSRFLTGTQGQHPGWDPLAWMVTQCHKRSMELHAWINPFRAKTKGTTALAPTHPYNQHPERFFAYDGLLIFDPGQEVNQRYICAIARDIVGRYDVDGLHIDDYFYPYPVTGLPIPDQQTFNTYRNGFNDINDWRRYNVNSFIKMLFETVRDTKPWVKFGVSPFGIYHNAKSGDRIPGSDTRGLQNYDDLYADVLFWVNNGWVDYLVPQLYWEIGHSSADYERLVKWWGAHAMGCPLVIGQDVERTVKVADAKVPGRNQMAEKMRLARETKGVSGNCFWYSAALTRNEGNYAYELQNDYHLFPALQPAMPQIDSKAPGKPKKLKAIWMPDGYYLFWTAPKGKAVMDQARQYAVYCFPQGEKIDLNSPQHMIAVTSATMFKLPYKNGNSKFTIVVTALDRLQNESKPVKVKVKL